MTASPHTANALKKLIADPFDKESCLHALSLMPEFPADVVDTVYGPLRVDEFKYGRLRVGTGTVSEFKKQMQRLLLMSGSVLGSAAWKDRQALRVLDLTCKKLTDLSPLIGLNSLTTLGISDGYRLTDLSPISEIKSLTTLNLRCQEITG